MDIPLDKYDFIVGFFVAMGLVVLAVLIIFLAGPDLFDFGSIEVHTYLPSAYGLKRGVPVSYLHFSVGHVKSVQLADPNALKKKVKVLFTINEEFQGIIKKDFTTSLEQEQLGGILSGNVILNPPEQPAEISVPVEDGDELRYHKMDTLFSDITNLSSQVQHELMPRVEAILQEFEIFLKRLNEPEGNVQQMMGNMKEISELLLDPEGELRQALSRANELMEKLADKNNNLMRILDDEKMYDALSEAVKNMRDLSARGDTLFDEALAAVSRGRSITEDAEPKISAVLDHLLELEKNTAKLLDDLQYVAHQARQASSSLPVMVSDVQEQLRRVDEITEAAKKIFLIRWYLEEGGIDDPVLLKPILLYDEHSRNRPDKE